MRARVYRDQQQHMCFYAFFSSPADLAQLTDYMMARIMFQARMQKSFQIKYLGGLRGGQ